MDMLYRLAVKRVLGREQGRDTRVERKEKTRKKFVCCVGPSFLGFSGYHKKPQKRKKHFLQAPPPFPLPNLSTTRPSCAQHLATACLFWLLGTNIKFKDGATLVPARMFLHFSTSRFVAIILHDLRGNNLIQQSFVTFFVSFLTDILIGSCFLPQQYSPARINVFARVLVTLTVHYSILFNPTLVQRLYLYDIFPPSSIKLF